MFLSLRMFAFPSYCGTFPVFYGMLSHVLYCESTIMFVLRIYVVPARLYIISLCVIWNFIFKHRNVRTEAYILSFLNFFFFFRFLAVECLGAITFVSAAICFTAHLFVVIFFLYVLLPFEPTEEESAVALIHCLVLHVSDGPLFGHFGVVRQLYCRRYSSSHLKHSSTCSGAVTGR